MYSYVDDDATYSCLIWTSSQRGKMLDIVVVGCMSMFKNNLGVYSVVTKEDHIYFLQAQITKVASVNLWILIKMFIAKTKKN